MAHEADIVKLLSGDDPDDIREGARLAGKAGLAAAIPLLVRHVTSTNIGVQEAVDRALRKIGGADVVHAVIPLLRSDEAPARNISMDILRDQGKSDLKSLVALLHDDDADIRIFASDILGSSGSAQAVEPLCHALLHDPEVNVRYQAAVSLGTLAFPEAADCLNKSLQDEEWVQFATIEALTALRVESSVGAMIKALEKSGDLVASTIVDALGEMGNIKAVPLLLKRLDASPTPLCNKIVRAVINILGERSLTLLGAKDCERMRGYLAVAVHDEDPEIQNAAIKGFAALGSPEATKAVLELAARLDPERDADRLPLIVDALVGIGWNEELEKAVRTAPDQLMQVVLGAVSCLDHPAATPLLIEIFPQRGRDAQRILATELAGRAGREHLPFFLDLVASHKDGTVLRAALLYLGRSGRPDEVEGPVLSLLSHPYVDVKESALEAAIVLRTPNIVRHFQEMITNPDHIQRMMGAYALGMFSADEYLGQLTRALTDESPEVRKVAVEALGRTCPISPERIELITARLIDENREVRMAVVETLGNCPEEHLSVCLTNGLHDPDTWVRVRCAEKLGERKAHSAVEPLVNMLDDDNPLIVIKAVEALGNIGGETAFRALLHMLEHPEPDVQAAAEEAVEDVRRRAGG